MKTCLMVRLCLLFILGIANEVDAQVNPGQPHPLITQLEDLNVTGKQTVEQAEAFVSNIGAPPSGRKMAVWSRSICVGSIGMAAEPAGYMVDRVLDWANHVGIRTSGPGCNPNILIVSTDDADRTAQALVRARPLDFDARAESSHRGRAALREFEQSDRPVRWWHVSIPVDPDTGDALVRQRGQQPFSIAATDAIIRAPVDLGAYGQIVSASRLYDDSLDHMQSLVIVIDAVAFEQVSFLQLSDYVAMIALAQISSSATPSVPSILTLFEQGVPQEETLTRWDRSFLEALYGTRQRNFKGAGDNRLIARGLARRIEAESR